MTSINLNTSLTNTALTGTRQDNSVGDTANQASIPETNSADSASSVNISSQARELAEVDEKAVPATNQASGKGYQIMLDRLFGGKESPVAGATGTIGSFMQLSQMFLTREDRALVADMYEYAQSQGADLNYVDEIAITMGRYRQSGKMSSFNDGYHYDSQGRQLSVSFDGEMAAMADSIKNGSAINSTRFDRGFLRYQLDPGFGALSSTYDPAFLEHMVNYFSDEGNTQEPLDSRFAVHLPQTPQRIESHYVIHANEDVRLPPWEPDIMNIDGKWFITEKGRANGITMEEILGIGSSRNRTAEINDENIRYLLDATFGKNAEKRPYWVNTFLEQMETDDDSGIRLFTPKVIDGKDFLFSVGTDAIK